MQGLDHGFSQVACRGSSSTSASGGSGSSSVVWNFPIDVTFKTTNAHGWPRLVVSVYSMDMLGRFVIRGYGSLLIPTVPGQYTRYIRTFAPASSSYLQAFLGWLTGNLPEFYDSRFVASSEGREVVRVQSTGIVRIRINVTTRGLASHGYTTGGPPDAPDLDIETAFAPAIAANIGRGVLSSSSGGNTSIRSGSATELRKSFSGELSSTITTEKPKLETTMTSDEKGNIEEKRNREMVKSVEDVAPGGGRERERDTERGRDRDRERDRSETRERNTSTSSSSSRRPVVGL
jgi:B9 domain-containing protein 1